jgi:hypothetical protein
MAEIKIYVTGCFQLYKEFYKQFFNLTIEPILVMAIYYDILY